MQKIILDTMTELKGFYFHDGTLHIGGERLKDLENFIKQALTKAFEAGQKSREKERLFNKAEWEHLYRLVKHDNYTGDYYGNKDQYYRRGKRIYKKLQQIKSLSLTKESK